MRDAAVSFDGTPVRYEVRGAGTPTLVFVHGWCCDRTYWEKQLDHFARRYQVVAVDLAGHGESGLERQAWTMPAFGRDVAAVVEKLGPEKVLLIGHSMGGPVIVEAARLLTGRLVGLVGADTYRTLGHIRTRQEIDESLAPLRANFVEGAREFVRGMFLPSSSPDLAQRIVDDMSEAPPEVAIGASEANRSNDLNLIAGLQELKAPVIAINSDYRPTDTEAAQRYGVKIKLMSGVGHFVMLEDPETFNCILEETVKELASAQVVN